MLPSPLRGGGSIEDGLLSIDSAPRGREYRGRLRSARGGRPQAARCAHTIAALQGRAASGASGGRAYSSAIGLRRSPTFPISTSTTSPAFIHSGGFLAAPTPEGVPVEITSPGTNSVKLEMYSMQWATV